MRESDIIHENGNYWVGRTLGAYTVFKIDGYVSYPDSSYENSEDGKSIAIARCNYLAERNL